MASGKKRETTPKKAPKYDVSEARELLAKYRVEVSLEHRNQHEAARAAAVGEVLEEAFALLDEYGYKVLPGDYGPFARIHPENDPVASVLIRSCGGFIEISAVKKYQPTTTVESQDIPFDFTFATHELTATEDDGRFPPVPGQRNRKRSPVAVVVDAVIEKIERSRKS